MFEALAKLLVAYALGNLMGGQLVGALRGGVDLRVLGSGNVGATNALRTQGPAFAALVLLIDVLKGVLAALLLPLLPWFAGSHPWPREWIGFACGIGVALGHCYPVALGFHGGKGVATLAGVFAALLTAILPWMLLVFALVVMVSGYVSAATLGAAFTALFYVLVIDAQAPDSAPALFTTAMVLLVLFKHRQNVQRLLQGTEHRFEKARLIGRLFDRRGA